MVSGKNRCLSLQIIRHLILTLQVVFDSCWKSQGREACDSAQVSPSFNMPAPYYGCVLIALGYSRSTILKITYFPGKSDKCRAALIFT